ncbi:AsmA-like C-terminal region-containing protein [Roseovarius sp. EL26]|uniref:AsmA-like C-terminal region-containing protein n=1 Tax=Roseovarius sp. EL26 TaxID=2126672 RepID=UPI000EA0F558|nr:AsmA-like C-terminal region-containing protein [Roseovarius sp. EL26]
MGTELTKGTKRKKRSIGLRVGIWTVSVLCLCLATILLALIAVMGMRIDAPDWVERQVIERLNRDTAGFSIAIDNIAVVLEEGWVPRLQLRGVALADDDGRSLARLSDVQTTVALSSLLRGQVKSRSISILGAQVLLRRNKNGQIGLTVGGAAPAVQEAPNMAALIEQAHQVLENPHFDALRQVDLRDLNVRFQDARVDKDWSVDGAIMSLKRDGRDLQISGNFALLGARDYVSTLSARYGGTIGEASARFGVSFEDISARDIAGQSPAMSWLEAVDAPISGSVRGEIDADGALSGLNATLQMAEGVVKPNAAAHPIAFSALRSYFRYDPSQEKITFDELFVDSKWGQLSASGKAHLVGMDQGWPNAILGQIEIQQLNANPAGLYPEPINLEGAHADLRLSLDPFVVTVGELSILDQDRRMIVAAEAAAQDKGWVVSVDAHLDKISSDRLLQLWPEDFKWKPRSWIAENVIDGLLTNAQFSMRIEPDEAPDLYLGFEFEEMSTQFVKGLPPIEGGTGRASIVGRRFVISADEGYVTPPQGGRVDIAGTSFIIPDTDVKSGPAQVMLRTNSTITAALALLNEKPFEFLDKAGRPVVLADGRAEVQGHINLLLKKRLLLEDVSFDLLGKLTQITSDKLIPEKVLTAQELRVHAVADRLEISGNGRIGQVPFEAIWGADLGANGTPGSRVEGWVELSARFLDEFRIGLPPGSMSGSARAPITLDLPKDGPGSFKLSSDLVGLGLRLQDLDWTHAAQDKGRLEVSGRLAEPVVVDQIILNAQGLEARGNVSLKPDGGLDRASFTSVKAGNWLDAPVELVGRGQGLPPAVRVLGGVFDVRHASVLKGPQDAGGSASSSRDRGPVTMVLDQLKITDGITLTNFKADLDLANGASGTFTGRVNQGGAISGRIVPQNGGSAFVIRSKDAGAVLASAGLLKNARDGIMELRLVPADEPGEFDGHILAQSMRLTDAPAMAALLNAVSIVGLVEQMGGDGIHFRTVEGRFHLAPDRVTVYSGAATGASMGISVDGYYDTNSGQMDMQGVISPIFALNALGGAYSRKGEGLFGFNFTLTGTAEDPDVYVNPLTALAPGLFRELFRRPAPTKDETTAEAGNEAEAQQDPAPNKAQTERERDR